MANKGTHLESAYPSMLNKPVSIYGYQTHNLYKDFPPIMKDGRVIVASWQPEAVTNNNLINLVGVTSNWKYRQYLTDNAVDIIKQNQAETMNDIGYVARYAKAPEEKYTRPHKYTSYLDNNTVFGYENSNLKQMYFTREELDARKVSPAITQAQFINKQ
jgi:hypothetical protein